MEKNNTVPIPMRNNQINFVLTVCLKWNEISIHQRPGDSLVEFLWKLHIFMSLMRFFRIEELDSAQNQAWCGIFLPTNEKNTKKKPVASSKMFLLVVEWQESWHAINDSEQTTKQCAVKIVRLNWHTNIN